MLSINTNLKIKINHKRQEELSQSNGTEWGHAEVKEELRPLEIFKVATHRGLVVDQQAYYGGEHNLTESLNQTMDRLQTEIKAAEPKATEPKAAEPKTAEPKEDK